MSSNLSELTDFGKKWAELSARAVSMGIPSAKISAVYDLDLQRLQTPGDYAMSDQEALQALSSVQQGSPTTPAPTQPFSVGSIPGYAVSDIKDLGVGLLGLFKKGAEDVIHPSDIAGQVSALWRDPRVLEDPAKTLADPSDWLHPSNIVNSLSNSPLLNAVLPGVADLGQLTKYGLKGGLEQLLEHPASSLLDVLPAATKGAEIAATVAKTGLTDDAVAAAKEAASYSPFDTSAQALKARKDFSDAIPSSVRRAALYGDKGLGSAVIRTLMGVPMDGDSFGEYLTRKLGEKTGGSVGWESIAVGRLFTQARRGYASDTAALSKELGDFYAEHGIDDPQDKELFSEIVTHYTPDWQKQLGITGEKADQLSEALSDYQEIVNEQANKDLGASRLGVVTDPRTGATEVRALDGNDGRVVRAATNAATLAGRAQGVRDSLEGLMGTRLGDNEVEGINKWLDDNLFSKTLGGGPRLPVLGGLTKRLREAAQKGDYSAVRRGLNVLQSRLRSSKFDKTAPAYKDLLSNIATARQVLKTYQDGTKPLTDARLATARLETLMDRYPEARFSPRMTELVSSGLLTHLRGADVSDEDFALGYEMVKNGIWKGEKFDELVGAKAFARIRQSAQQTLIEERAAGLDPIWVPSITSGELPRIGQAGIDIERISKSRSLKSRAAITPSAIYEPVLGMIRKGAEDLEEKAMTELFFGDGGIKARWGLTRDQVVPQALQFVKGVSLEGSRATTSHVVDHWIEQNYTAIRPRDWISKGRVGAAGMGATSDEEFLIPKSVAKALEANVKATRGPQNFASKAYLRGTQVFRYSLLNFSPRYQAHIYFGGMTLGVLSEGPNILRYLPAAAGMTIHDSEGLLSFVKSSRFRGPFKPVVEWLQSKAAKAGETEGLNPRITHELAESNPDLIKEYNYAAGSKLGKWLDQAMAARGLSAGLHMATFGANMWRAAAYLSGKSRGGVEEGLKTALKVYADMDALTPLERTLTRYAIPFYGWTRHILRYALELPMDHPLRAAILSRMADQEWQDWPTGLPMDLMYLFQIGGTDAAGNAKVVDIRQLDPLRSVTDVFTMAGFLGSLNPLFQSVAVPALGINPETASPEDLYPTLTLDQFYGTKTAARPNPLSVLAQGIGGYIPEASVIDHFVGISSYTRWAKQNDPQAYRNQLMQSLNFPWLPQTVNLNQTIAKTELTNYSLASSAATNALTNPDPNSSTWKSLIQDFNYVPYESWLVQPTELRRWVFQQVEGTQYWNAQTQTATLPPNQIIVAPKPPRL